VRVANTLPDVNPDEVLAELDTDTRAYLRVLLNSGGEAFTDHGTHKQSASADLRVSFKRFEPTSRDAGRITGLLAQRRHNIKHVIHNFQQLATEVGTKDDQLGQLVDSANANFNAFADEEAGIRESLRLLPGTLGQTQTTLTKASALAAHLGPTLQGLRPGRAGSRPVAAPQPAIPARDHASDQERAAPIRPRRAADRARPAPCGKGPERGVAAPAAHLRRCRPPTRLAMQPAHA